MALLPILRYPDSRLHTVAAPVARVDDRNPQAGRRHGRDHVQGAGHRAGRHPGQRAQAHRRHRRLRGQVGPDGADQPRDPRAFGRTGVRGRLPVRTRNLREGVARRACESARPERKGRVLRVRGRRSARGVRPARDRSPRRQGLRRNTCRSSSSAASSPSWPRRPASPRDGRHRIRGRRPARRLRRHPRIRRPGARLHPEGRLRGPARAHPARPPRRARHEAQPECGQAARARPRHRG